MLGTGKHTIDTTLNILLDGAIKDLSLSPDLYDAPNLLLDVNGSAFVCYSCCFGDDLGLMISAVNIIVSRDLQAQMRSENRPFCGP
jgi:hypothetical protein